ncbi:DEAD/DEAH box helicase [Amaricoccus solimangrovi]|uniref:Type III restriction endonuclease subunit R n=1 Tax=Amaricoccus solimangrovi TaxID=2589815 RepID=A0A501WT34_9RHOB|nr:DEAD/DEAH box helicase family protein [Amaricoccus solimangrovi]TPE52579.1 type III restriction endonuclease subunit R [Amaricoccus solimangrovi]
MRTLDYQQRVLDTIDAYLDELKAEKFRADKVAAMAEAEPDLGLEVPDYAARAWAKIKGAGRLPPSRGAVPFSPRKDGIGRAVPNVTLKVPTGGGKTWLAVNAVSRIMGRYLARNTGFVLWIVPNEAIYSQTLKRLRDRQHPYRQALDRAAAGRVKVMEKGDRLDARDVDANLCVMVLMLQAANRQTQEALRMFRDRGDVHGFFAPEGDQAAHLREFEAIPNLDGYQDMLPMVKDSLGNALRKIRPVVVMDEGQKATSDLAHDTLYGFNPIFVLELTATPKDVGERRPPNPRPARYANLLVEVTGRELHAEDMIKMPLNLDPRQGVDWRATLTAALRRLNALQAEATAYGADKGELGYIRPIMLVQVERTGKEQRDGAHIHAEDVKEWLLRSGLDEAEVAIKTAEQNDLNQPENLDLLAPTNRVRVIVTKAALQEGWDCPFAYVLCSLAAASNLSAMTQLVGRILRQPYAMKTGVPALDECYVVTHHAGTRDVVEAIKRGLEKDGLADLVIEVPEGGGAPDPGTARKVERRPELRSLRIYLPKVLREDGERHRELDYETDILAGIDWRDYSPSKVAAAIPENPREAAAQLQRITLTDAGEDEFFKGEALAAAAETLRFDASYAVRVISDLVPNPFVARGIIGELLAALKARGFDREKLGRASGVIIDALRLALADEQDARAEALFRAEVAAGRIQFRLRLDGDNWRMPDTITTTEGPRSPHLTGADGGALVRSLFSPVFRNELNGEEQNVAVHLDGEGAVKWWHRNVAKANYGLQGWKRGRIYPDFIFATGGTAGAGRIVVLETKGDHLRNPDTDYKRDVLNFLTESFAWDQAVPAGQLAIEMTGETVECALVLMQDVPTVLPGLIAK